MGFTPVLALGLKFAACYIPGYLLPGFLPDAEHRQPVVQGVEHGSKNSTCRQEEEKHLTIGLDRVRAKNQPLKTTQIRTEEVRSIGCRIPITLSLGQLCINDASDWDEGKVENSFAKDILYISTLLLDHENPTPTPDIGSCLPPPSPLLLGLTVSQQIPPSSTEESSLLCAGAEVLRN